jgi:hypothetical protein
MHKILVMTPTRLLLPGTEYFCITVKDAVTFHHAFHPGYNMSRIGAALLHEAAFGRQIIHRPQPGCHELAVSLALDTMQQYNRVESERLFHSHLRDPTTADGLLDVLHLVLILVAVPATTMAHRQSLRDAFLAFIQDINQKFEVQLEDGVDTDICTAIVQPVVIAVGVSIHQLALWCENTQRSQILDILKEHIQTASHLMEDAKPRLADAIRSDRQIDAFGWHPNFRLRSRLSE